MKAWVISPFGGPLSKKARKKKLATEWKVEMVVLNLSHLLLFAVEFLPLLTFCTIRFQVCFWPVSGRFSAGFRPVQAGFRNSQQLQLLPLVFDLRLPTSDLLQKEKKNKKEKKKK